MDRDTHFWTIVCAVGLVLAAAFALGAVVLQSLGIALVGLSLLLLLLGGLLAGVVLAWPVAYVIIILVYWARPGPVAPSVDYTLGMGREAGGRETEEPGRDGGKR